MKESSINTGGIPKKEDKQGKSVVFDENTLQGLKKGSVEVS